MAAAEKPDASGVYVDGQSYTIEDLTYRERREMRKVAAELLELEPEQARTLNVLDLPEEDGMPVFIWIIKRRSDPEYAMKSALELKSSDLEAPPVDPPKRRASR